MIFKNNICTFCLYFWKKSVTRVCFLDMVEVASSARRVDHNLSFLSPLRSVRRRLHGFEAMVKLNDYHKPIVSFTHLICLSQ